MNKGNQKGITLIALIITIIVILILVAVTVSTAANSGLFDHAKDATNKWATEQDRESNIGDEVDKLIYEYVGDYYVGTYGQITDEWGYGDIVLKEKKSNEPTEFQKAYINYKGEKIDISDCIWFEEESYPFIRTNVLRSKLYEKGYENTWEIQGTEQEIILVKDKIEYIGKINIRFYHES